MLLERSHPSVVENLEEYPFLITGDLLFLSHTVYCASHLDHLRVGRTHRICEFCRHILIRLSGENAGG